jgi:hypothetical protein
MPRLHAADAKESYRFEAASGRGAVGEIVQGNGAGHASCSAGVLPVSSAGLAESEREQARAKQHEACCGYCEESFGYEIIITHDAPADRDAGPNLLKLSESFPLQHRPRTIALISVRNENAGADEAEKCRNCLDHRNCPYTPLGRQKRQAGPHSQKDFEPAAKIAIRLMIWSNTAFRRTAHCRRFVAAAVRNQGRYAAILW